MDSETTSTFINPAEAEFAGNPSVDDDDEIDEAALGHDAGRIEAAKKLRDLKRVLRKESQEAAEEPAPPAHKHSSAIQHFVAPLQNLFTSFTAPAAAAKDDSTVEPHDPTGYPIVEEKDTITAAEKKDAPHCDHVPPDTTFGGDKSTVLSAGAIFQAELEKRESHNKEAAAGVPQSVEKNAEEEVNATAALMERKIHVQANCDKGEVEDKEA